MIKIGIEERLIIMNKNKKTMKDFKGKLRKLNNLLKNWRKLRNKITLVKLFNCCLTMIKNHRILGQQKSHLPQTLTLIHH